jgi:hypothetical protein
LMFYQSIICGNKRTEHNWMNHSNTAQLNTANF